MQTYPQIQRRFRNRGSVIQELFADDLPQSERFELDTKTYLRSLFRRLEDILQTKEVWNFRAFLEQERYVPQDFDITNLTFKLFSELFDLWVQSQYKNQSLAESVYIEDIKSTRNPQFQNILQEKNRVLHHFLQSIPNKKSLKPDEMAKLLKQLLSQYYIYEFAVDSDDLTSKPNFNTTVLDVIQSYLISEKQGKQLKDQELFLVDDVPLIMRFWQKINPQLVVQPRKRRILTNCGVQTDKIDKTIPNTGKLLINTSSSNHYKDTLKATVQSTINNAINELSEHLSQFKDSNWLESIEYLLITLKKQRKSLYPKYKLKLSPHQKTKYSEVQEKLDDSRIIQLQKDSAAIYEYYMKKSTEIKVDLSNMSFLGDYAEDAIKSNKDVFTIIDYNNFLQDILKFANIQNLDLAKSGALLDSNRKFTLNAFTVAIRELIEKKQSKITTRIIHSFVKDVINFEIKKQSSPYAQKLRYTQNLKRVQTHDFGIERNFKKNKSNQEKKHQARTTRLSSIKRCQNKESHGISESLVHKSFQRQSIHNPFSNDINKLALERDISKIHKASNQTNNFGFNQGDRKEVSQRRRRHFKNY